MAKKHSKTKDHPLTGLFMSTDVGEGAERQVQYTGQIVGAASDGVVVQFSKSDELKWFPISAVAEWKLFVSAKLRDASSGVPKTAHQEEEQQQKKKKAH